MLNVCDFFFVYKQTWCHIVNLTIFRVIQKNKLTRSISNCSDKLDCATLLEDQCERLCIIILSNLISSGVKFCFEVMLLNFNLY